MKQGLRLAIGSWKIIAISDPAMARRCSGDMARRSRPSKRRRSAVTVAVGGRRPMTASMATDLPEPDLPTMASTSPVSTERSMPCTAKNRPAAVSKETLRLRTSRRGIRGTSAAGGVERGPERNYIRVDEHDHDLRGSTRNVRGNAERQGVRTRKRRPRSRVTTSHCGTIEGRPGESRVFLLASRMYGRKAERNFDDAKCGFGIDHRLMVYAHEIQKRPPPAAPAPEPCNGPNVYPPPSG